MFLNMVQIYIDTNNSTNPTILAILETLTPDMKNVSQPHTHL